MTILDRIVAGKREVVARARARRPLAELRAALPDAPPARGFLAALAPSRPRDGGPIKLIAEVKKASPSAGLIRDDFDPPRLAAAYEAAGATCLSVLTDEEHFQGSLADLQAARGAVRLPVLRKDFVIDEHQVIEARVAGADAVLLIAECLPGDELPRLHDAAVGVGLDVLVELYDPENLPRVLAAGARLVGVNNRDLRTFQVDLGHCVRLHAAAPPGVLFVAESGVQSGEQALQLRRAGIDAMLVGESLMRSSDVAEATRRLLAGANGGGAAE